MKEEDKDAYIKDYLEGVRRGRMVKIIDFEHTGDIIYEVTTNMITGVISKPL